MHGHGGVVSVVTERRRQLSSTSDTERCIFILECSSVVEIPPLKVIITAVIKHSLGASGESLHSVSQYSAEKGRSPFSDFQGKSAASVFVVDFFFFFFFYLLCPPFYSSSGDPMPLLTRR